MVFTHMERSVKVHTTRKAEEGRPEDEEEEQTTDDFSNYGTDKISRIKLHFN
jgi:hypothetical protein